MLYPNHLTFAMLAFLGSAGLALVTQPRVAAAQEDKEELIELHRAAKERRRLEHEAGRAMPREERQLYREQLKQEREERRELRTQERKDRQEANRERKLLREENKLERKERRKDGIREAKDELHLHIQHLAICDRLLQLGEQTQSAALTHEAMELISLELQRHHLALDSLLHAAVGRDAQNPTELRQPAPAPKEQP